MLRAFVLGIPILIVIYYVVIGLLPFAQRRKARHAATLVLGGAAVVLALIPLVLLITHLVREGWGGLSLDFFTQDQKPIGQTGGGMRHAIIGSLIIVGMASCIGIPVGVLAGIYLAEVGKGKFAATIRFLSEVLTGLPSIIAGILGYTLIVMRYNQFSAIAGAVALAILMIPVITRVTEEAILLVPKSMREASYGLGSSQTQTVIKVVLPAARSAILTGIVLAVARVGGETAPLLLTAVGQSTLQTDVTKSMAALPLSIYLNANQPFDSSQQLAVTGALFLVLWIAFVNLTISAIAAKTRPRLS
ncbi:MAG TPA: phosphate ABC transporter permease PstA [Fimbriimonadaceae bacterium]|nr:phosphate ABC transporter permease PstA [Fimbriimonadaceae bacterium]HRJ33280.1 phosphate ABC transporter permease PstA [Fimbriimonadaceae bacterium]